ncbi:hypothetical protein F4824DRAFT_269713 [Ustulina deusta]|nr:hypothetical protein F4824DRAFT_269713 [Ustulina deusta]
MSRVAFEGWRVVDDKSFVKYQPGRGFYARSDESIEMNLPTHPTQKEKERLYETVHQHLNWYNKVATPYISAYSDEERAVQEADRRVSARKRNVVIYKIIVYAGRGVTFRSMRKLFDKVFEKDVPDFVGNNAEYEFIFLHCIPEDCIVGWEAIN